MSIPASTSTDLVIAPVHKGRKELVSASGVQAWLDEVSSGERLFTGVVPRGMDYGENVWLNSTLAGSLGGLAGMLATGMVSAVGPVDLSIILGLFGAGAATGFFGGLPFFKRNESRGQKRFNLILAIQRLGLQNWLKARYGLEVDEQTLNSIAYKSLHNYLAINFTDVSGRNWQVEYSDGRNKFAVVPLEVTSDREVRVVNADSVVSMKAEVVESPLPGEAGSLLSSVRSRLTALKALSLGVESSHVVKRVEEDIRQAVATFRKLESLGAGFDGVERLVFVLNALNDELRGLVDAEVLAAKEDLTVQGNYVKSRHLEASVSSRLSLEAPVVNAVVKVESSNV